MNSPIGASGYGPTRCLFSYVPAQLLARLPEAFLFLLAVALVFTLYALVVVARETGARWRVDRTASLRTALLTIVRARACLIVWAAVILPLAFLIVQHATIYNGVRHVLFVIPMLAVIAGGGLRALLPLLRRAPVVTAVAGDVAFSAVSSPPLLCCIRSNMWR